MKGNKSITNKLQAMINESVRKILQEEFHKRGADEWFRIQDMLGETEMLDALYIYLDSDTIEDFCEYTRRMYNLDEE